MATRKYHLVLGLVCLCICIVLPTITYHYIITISTQNLFRPIGFSTSLIEIILFGFLIVLLMTWLAALYFALRELGGYMLQLGKSESEFRHRLHDSFHKHYLDTH